MVIDHTFFDFIKMHLVEILLLLAYLMYSNFASDLSDSDYYEYDEQMHEEESDSSLPEPDMEERLRSASSVDELMSLIYPFYWAALKCKSKLPFASVSKLSHHLEPLIETDQTNFAAAYLNLDVLKSVESEWRKTQCRPRCGGCCHSEDKQCRNISTGYLSKTLFEITVPIAQGTKPVTISVANHTQCSCLSKLDSYKQVHSIIRRSLTECSVASQTCAPNEAWSSRHCQCVSTTSEFPPSLPLPSPPKLGERLPIFSPKCCMNGAFLCSVHQSKLEEILGI
ncbi:vascular endothelial growth factor C isoform X3 [Hippocampus comes]|uniref:vascular endothelial growth factor C isoform X3 n=1 Tax=Hippocampus comes TaxID=109280 RepID=UPI00094F32C9|nr:PREDICTED: vascular endothelial growth factor C isoform X3 [Hippocampus comes]